MAVTSYYTVGGKIIGEETSGERIDYLTDALGSVTGTVDQSGTVQNTYRYKPYGALLTKTGVAPDPAFGWIGREGYRLCPGEFNGFYVRTRHYGTTTARWHTEDSLRWAAGISLYQYAESNPTTFVDPTGQLSISVAEQGHALDNCGAAKFVIDWVGPFTSDDNGYIIQHVVFVPRVYVCDCPNCTTTAKNPTANISISYTEAWQVKRGVICEGRCKPRNVVPGPFVAHADYFQTVSEGVACGSISIIAFAKYVPNYELYSPPWGNTGTPANGLPTLIGTLPGWTDYGPGSVPHFMTVKFNCCAGSSTPETVVTLP